MRAASTKAAALGGLAVLVSLLCSGATAGPTVAGTQYLGPFVGLGAPLHPNNAQPEPVRFYGTDLGFSYAHLGRLEFLFGDTLANERGEVIEPYSGRLYDDSFGWLNLADWPDPAAIGPGNLPVLELGQHPGTRELIAIDPGHVFDGLKTPEAGFSDGANQFAVLVLTKPQGCRVDADCADGLSCDPELGYRGVPWDEPRGLTLGCFDGQDGCVADTVQTLDEQPVPGTGLCADPTSSMRSDTPAGQVSAMALRLRIGLRSPSKPGKYRTVADWMTNKFFNTTTRTISRFGPGQWAVDPAVAGEQRPRVLLWGRPGFIGVLAAGRNLGLYFAWAEIPAAPDFSWHPHYFTGLDDSGAARFSDRQTDAVALDLDATAPGVQPAEPNDVVQHMSVAWVDRLHKWVMFYGGGIDVTPIPALGLMRCGLLEIFVAGDCEQVGLGNGAVHMRTANDPWGPWSPPQAVIVAGDPTVGGADQYGPGGALYHPACKGESCAPHTPIPVFHDQGYGWFYGANIIQEWIRPAGDGVDVLWNASTWDPYRVVMLRTRIDP